MRIKGEWYFSGPNDTTTTSSAGRLPAQWQVGDFPIAFPNQGPPANWPVQEMVKDAATGVWSFTTPLPSGTFNYSFFRNCDAAAPDLTGCTGAADPSNPPWNVVNGASVGSVETQSQVYVPSDPSFGTVDMSWQAPNAVHGTLQDLTYDDPESTDPAGKHYVAVYTPPGYDAHRAVAYPTLYLSHGGGGNEVDWSTQGIANRIVDNLIAQGKLQPTVIVMTNFNGLAGSALPAYQTDVLTRVIPFVESKFNVSHNASERAFAGLSAGGQRANQLIYNATTSFGYFASWSTFGNVPPAGDPRWANPDLKTRLGLVSGGGADDPRTLPGVLDIQQQLKDNDVPFVSDYTRSGHNWYVWRQLLYNYLTKVAFRQTTTTYSTSGRTITATVTPGTTEPAAPTGSVQFLTGGQPLGSPVPLSDGKATITVPDSLGKTTVTARYSGDAFYNPSTVSGASVAATVTNPSTRAATTVDRTVAIRRATLRVNSKRHVKVQLVCGPSTATECRGVVQLLAGGKRVLARRSFTTGAGQYHNVTLTLTRDAYRRLKNKAESVSIILLTRGSDGVLRRAEESKIRIARA
jgi:enterochelin esterase-like enzyme